MDWIKSGFQQGDRVRVVNSGSFYDGREGEIVRLAVCSFELYRVKMPGTSSGAVYFFENELEKI